MLSDLEIAQAATMKPIEEIAKDAGILREELELHGDYKAKVKLQILDRLSKMDETLTPDKPLLQEIDRIDVSNYKGRQNDNQAHIILYSKDNTPILWGAEIGTWQRHLESTDEDKLAKLYHYYETYGSLSGRAKIINLYDPRDKVPLPIDRY